MIFYFEVLFIAFVVLNVLFMIFEITQNGMVKIEGYYIYYVTKDGKSAKLLKTLYVNKEEADKTRQDKTRQDKTRQELEELYSADKKPIIYKVE